MSEGLIFRQRRGGEQTQGTAQDRGGGGGGAEGGRGARLARRLSGNPPPKGGPSTPRCAWPGPLPTREVAFGPGVSPDPCWAVGP